VNARSAARLARGLALLLATLAPAFAGAGGVGENLYRNGVLPSGKPLTAERGGAPLSGQAAACINCHRRSGLGMTEGRTGIPPVAGIYLFQSYTTASHEIQLPYVETIRPNRVPYDDATLARAIRDGLGSDGKPLNVLMPRYALDAATMGALIVYLKKLSPGRVGGVTEGALDFATIVTPDADPVKREGVLNVLEKFVEDKNHYVRATTAPRVSSNQPMRFKANRRWILHVWELTGPPDTWERQLDAKLRIQPVFAVISGVGGKTWAPVQRFCEANELPCLFPNVDVPVVEGSEYDSLYFSEGVLLEARLIAQAIEAQRAEGKVKRVVQVYRTTDVGDAAAAALAAAMPKGGLVFVNRPLDAKAGARELAAATSTLEPGDAAVLWLRSADLAALGGAPKEPAAVFVSGRMGGLEAAPLPAAWRAVAQLAYPVDLPERRVVRVDFPRGWFRIKRIPVVALPEQVDTWLACSILSDTINRMADTFVRDYLVERIQGTLEHRVITGYYPRLALAPGQQFASKGGYLVRFAEPTGDRVVPVGAWATP
jgi:hypothetical protein